MDYITEVKSWQECSSEEEPETRSIGPLPTLKHCRKCGQDKDPSEFGKDAGRKDGLRGRCRSCINAYSAGVFEQNREKVLERQRRRYSNNKDHVKRIQYKSYTKNKHKRKISSAIYSKENRAKIYERVKMRRLENQDKYKEKSKLYYLKNKDKRRERHKAFYLANRERILATQAKYKQERYATDPVFLAKQRMHNLTHDAFRRSPYTKKSKSFRLIGCSVERLLEIWGISSIPVGYHIDHIVPLAQARSIEELEKLCHYSNLRPIPAEANLSKGDRKTEENEKLCAILLGRAWNETQSVLGEKND
jgi:hypothetical protein